MRKIKVGDTELATVDRGKGTPLLLVHGFPLDHTMWQGQLAGLEDEFRIIAPDLRGFGQSPRSGEHFTMESAADDLAQLLDALEIDEPVHFCGLSMGGYIAWQFYRRHRDRLRSLILCDTRAASDTEEARANRKKMASHVRQYGSVRIAEAMLPKLFAAASCQRLPEVVRGVESVILGTSPETIGAALEGMALRPDVTSDLPAIDVPALLICGEHDEISPSVEMEQIAAAIPGSRFVEVPGVGHMAPLESPEFVNEAIRKFCAVA